MGRSSLYGRYDVDEGFEALVVRARACSPRVPPRARRVTRPAQGRVGVSDLSPDGACPVVAEVLLDGVEAWASAPMAAPGDSHFVRLFLRGARSVTLRMRAAPSAAGAGTPAFAAPAFTTWSDARFSRPRDWSWCARPPPFPRPCVLCRVCPAVCGLHVTPSRP